MFETLPKSVIKAWNIDWPQPLLIEGMELYINDNVAIQTNAQYVLAPSDKNRSMLFCAVGWAELKLDMKRSSSEMKSTMYAQTPLKKGNEESSAANRSRCMCWKFEKNLFWMIASPPHPWPWENCENRNEQTCQGNVSIVHHLRRECQKFGGGNQAWRRRGSGWKGMICPGRPSV